MILRRAGGQLRWLPADLVAWPCTLVGLWFLTGADWLANRVADGQWTVRALVDSPVAWLTRPLGWVGLLLVAVGIVASVLAHKLAKAGRWGTATRYWPYRLAALVLVAGVILSSWRPYGFVSDMASGGFQLRFLAVPRTRLVNDITTIVLAAGALAFFVFSFGRIRAPEPIVRRKPAPLGDTAEAESIVVTRVPARPPAAVAAPPAAAAAPAYAKRERVPTTTRASTRRTAPMPTGVASHTRSRSSSRLPDDGS